MAEFTGERVIPGQVDEDLWNEHVSRYAFAARLSHRKRVLDLGCGAGYGAVQLANTASRVAAVDISGETLHSAKISGSEIDWVQASAQALPFRAAAFDLIVAFEVIEHLENWREMLCEARRALAPGGQFIVSTPNKAYYTESRQQSGPNPFHHQEFEFNEFTQELAAIFPYISTFTQNHEDGIVFRPVAGGQTAEIDLAAGPAEPHGAHFFVAICALATQSEPSGFAYMPRSGNVLRERERHIARLEAELATKNQWLVEAHEEHERLVEMHREQKLLLEKSNNWAAGLDAKLRAAGRRIVELQDELAREQSAALNRIAELEASSAEMEGWARDTDARLENTTAELARCVELLHEAEKTVEERTTWALSLDARKQALETKVGMALASRWLRLGRAIGVGPELRDR